MINFDEENHIYTVYGKQVPSVTQILKEVFPNKYSGIPPEILEKKAEYGKQVHKYIEIIEKKKPKKPLAYIKRYYNPDMYQEENIKQYLKIKEENKIKVLASEKMVLYGLYYCGTLDMLASVNGKRAIIDIKTTAELDELYVSYQNSLYEMANGKVDKLYCLWLPKGHIGKLIEVNRIDNNLLKIIIGEIE